MSGDVAAVERIERAWATPVALAALSAATLGALMAVLPVYSAVAALVIIIGAVVAVWTEAWLALFIAAEPLQGISLFGVEAFGFRLSHVFFLVALFLAISRSLLSGRITLPRLNRLDGLVLAFVALKELSLLWSPAPLASSGVSAGKLVFDVMVYVTLAALVERDAQRTFLQIVVGYSLAFIYLPAIALYRLATLGFTRLVAEVVLEGALTGSQGIDTFSHATASLSGRANQTIIASWAVLGLMLVWGVVTPRWRGLGRAERLWWIGTGVAAGCYIVLSLARATWLSLVVGCFVVWWVSGYPLSRRIVTLVGVALVAVVGGVLASGLGPVILIRVRAAAALGRDYGVSSRFDVWTAVLQRFAQHPFFGVGMEGTQAMTREMTTGGIAGNPHNVYIQVLAELGLVGACVFAAMLGQLMWDLRRAGRAFGMPLRTMTWGLFAAVCCYLTQSLAQYDFMDLGIWTLLGLSAGVHRLWLQRSVLEGSA